jgi:hypothetical protein
VFLTVCGASLFLAHGEHTQSLAADTLQDFAQKLASPNCGERALSRHVLGVLQSIGNELRFGLVCFFRGFFQPSAICGGVAGVLEG